MLTQILTSVSDRPNSPSPDPKIVYSILRFSTFYDEILRFKLFPCTVIFCPIMRIGLAILQSKSLYTGTATEGSAPMLADRRLKMHFLTGNWMQKVEIWGQTRSGSSFSCHLGPKNGKIAEKCLKVISDGFS